MNVEFSEARSAGQQDSPETIVIAISSDSMGRGDEELGKVLLRNYIHALTDIEHKPQVLIFFNSGVTLATEGSPLLTDLALLEDQGVRILLCGTCLAHYDLKDQVKVGEISNMYAISETMLRAAKVINL